MQKDFDSWNIKKKLIHSNGESIKAHQRELWWVSFGINVGVEIDGKNKSYERAAIVLRRFNNDMIWVIPVTSQEKKAPFYASFTFNENTYWAALTQLRTVSTKRLLRKMGMIPQRDFVSMQKMIAVFVSKDERSSAWSGASRRPKP